MSKLIQKCQKETLVYWPPCEANAYGENQWQAPVEMTCRWDDKMQEIQTPRGTRVVSRIELITQSLLHVDGYVYRGSLADLTRPDDPTCNPGAYQILKAAETPTLNYRRRLYEAWA